MIARGSAVGLLGAGAIATCALGATIVASAVPDRPAMGVVWAVVAIAAALFAAACVAAARFARLGRRRFAQVGRAALAAYVVIGGMIEFAFVHDATPEPQLGALSAIVAIFVLDVTLLLAFSVARYSDE